MESLFIALTEAVSGAPLLALSAALAWGVLSVVPSPCHLASIPLIVGHCAVIVLAGTFTEVIQRYLDWNERSRGAVLLKKICGVLVIAGGIRLIYTAPL
ncbi:hypothetical protein [Geoalkalibacter subterraneus]|uniref:Cytochrome C biogenesis protein transmembrane domain-containing protein n=1 Tax=Geoalkalibacter subterraneus TaxID=483547 RepID=A0A0B5FTW1_9BACT|nr:hypothetical protein [Geoalkalibacter subterraneus]AJF07031.1 hypothetical protein GSUB_11280 [Geoalkalibacter subterraneus]